MRTSDGWGLDELEAAACKRSFRRFIHRAWEEVDPAPFIDNWHVDAIADHLQAVAQGYIQRLIINVSPGAAKSMITSVLWPAWMWARNPAWQILCASYEQGLSTRDAVKSRDLMRTPWYTKWFRSEGSPIIGAGWDFAKDQDLKTYFRNTQQGHRASLGVGGKGTGYRGDALLIDDPISVKDAYSKVKRDSCIQWKDTTMSSRFNDKANAQEVLIMQRVHEEDLTGHLLGQGGWDHLFIPAKFEKSRICKTSLPSRDHRTKEGESFFPQVFPDSVLARLRIELGSYAFAGQYQQTPAPQEGGLIKREWFNRRWVKPGQEKVAGIDCRMLPAAFDHVSMFTDAAFKAKEDSDRVAIAVVGVSGPDVYLLKLAWDRMTFTETLARIIDLKNAFPMVSGIFVEDKANGSAIMDALRTKLPGLIPIEPEGGKEARISAVTPYIEAGNFWLPMYDGVWVEDFITEAISFPKAAHDDAIDCIAYALLKYCNKPMGILEALERLDAELAISS